VKARAKRNVKEVQFMTTQNSGTVTGILIKPGKPRGFLVLGHGAGAGMRHPFMESVTERLADHGVATFRYEFPYMEHGKKRPDRQPILLATVRSATAEGARFAGSLPLFAGGKSMGGRMTSLADGKTILGTR
jgi:predicted alpha/beta-hydrolase family hydrolase